MSDFGNLTDDELVKLRQIRAGGYLSTLRSEHNLTLKAVASELEVSFQYLSEIEKGNKLPSDLLLHEIAKVFKLGTEDEVDLFHRYGRIPLLTMQELKNQKSTHLVFAQLRQLVMDGKITEQQRQELYAEFARVCRDFMTRVLPPTDSGNS